MNRKAIITILICLVLADFLATSVAAQSNPPQTTVNIPLAQKKSTSKLSRRLETLAASAPLRAASQAEQARTLSLPEKGAGSLSRDARGRLLVEMRVADSSSAVQQGLRAAGAEITHVSNRYRVITALVDASRLTSIAGLAAVQNVHEVLQPHKASRDMPPTQLPDTVAAPSYTCPWGNARTEGDMQLNADDARSTFTIDGAGESIGILSDSYDVWASAPTHASDDVASGDLPGGSNPCSYPTAVDVLAETVSSGTADEGRAMLQIAHDLAPGATLKFATAWDGLTSFADNIRALRTAGSTLITDDIFYFEEPFFQEGPVNVAISDVVASGVTYFTAAGNENLNVSGNYVASYEAPSYRPATCPASLPGADCHDFETGAGVNTFDSITLINGGAIQVEFQFNEPWYGVADDFDVYLLDSSNNFITCGCDYNPSKQRPDEYFSFQNSSGSTQTYRLVINRYSGTSTPRIKFIFIQGTTGVTAVQYNTSTGGDVVGPAITGHSATLFGLSVGAVPYYNSTIPETYSSRGPAAHYYGPVVDANPAPAITPYTLHQPDFAATDGGCTTFFYNFSGGCYRFFGTSAAAPHAAAVAALVRQRASQLSMPMNPGLLKFALQSSAATVSGGDIHSVGSGLLDALGAANKLPNIRFYYFPLVNR